MNETVRQIEIILAQIVRNSLEKRTWDEDHITFTLVEKMQDFFTHRRIDFQGWHKRVSWESYKNKGKQETKYGDIALLVNIQFSDGGILKGVACIEAKRTFPSHNFDSLDINQLRRIYANIPHSQLMLYTHSNPGIPLKFPDTRSWDSNFWVATINASKELLPQIEAENSKILRISFPFSMFLLSRIFWGHDLDYRDDIYRDIQRGIEMFDNEYQPSYLAVINVYYDHQNPIQVDLSENWARLS